MQQWRQTHFFLGKSCGAEAPLAGGSFLQSGRPTSDGNDLTTRKLLMSFRKNPYPQKNTPSRQIFASPFTNVSSAHAYKKTERHSGWCRGRVPRVPEVFSRNCFFFNFATIFGQLSTLCRNDIRKYLGRMRVVVRPQLRHGRFVDSTFPFQQMPCEQKGSAVPH